MKKSCINKFFQKKQTQQPQQQQVQPANYNSGYNYNNSYYNYPNYQGQQQQQQQQQSQQQYQQQYQQQPFYSQPVFNNNYGWPSYQSSNYRVPQAPIIYEIRDVSAGEDSWDEEYHVSVKRSKSSRREEESCVRERSSRPRTLIVPLPIGPPPPPKTNSKSKHSSRNYYRPVYSPPVASDKLTMAQYSDNEPTDYAAYHQSSIQPEPTEAASSDTNDQESGTELPEGYSERPVDHQLPNESQIDPSLESPEEDQIQQLSNLPSPVIAVQSPTETQAETPSEISTETPAETPTETPVETLSETPTETPAKTPKSSLPIQTEAIDSKLSNVIPDIHTENEAPRKYSSEIERSIRTATRPIDMDDYEEIEIPELGVKGIWINKSEEKNWKGGDVPLSEYKIHVDKNPEVIQLKYSGCVERIEARSVKFLKPIQPPPPGDIIITKLPDYQPPEAPPIIIRQLAPEHCDPKPKIIRERPPELPEVVPTKEIFIPGKRLDPPARKVIIEKLAKEPDEIKGIVVERWLPYDRPSRRVIYNKAAEVELINVGHNIEYVWESPCVESRVEFQNLGVETVDPASYLETNNGKLIKSKAEIPDFALQTEAPGNIDLNHVSTLTNTHSLVGDLEALSLVDLDKEGLSVYRKYIEN